MELAKPIASPAPEPTAAPAVVPYLGPPPTVRTDLVCHATTCSETPLVHWQRRLTADEVDIEHAIERHKRDGWLELRDVEQPMPDYGPLPDPSSYSYLVYACADHAIDMDAAGLVHQNTCAGPDSDALPLCDCDPEPAPAPRPRPVQPVPARWAAAMAGGA